MEEEVRKSILTSVERPRAPIKKRIPQNLPGSKLDAANLGLEEYSDEDDPTYLDQLEVYLQQLNLNSERVLAYRVMCGVKGFDLTDEEIKTELSVEAHSREPLDSLLLRLDQLREIIFTEADQIHIGLLVRKVMELSGVDFQAVNFT